MRTAEVVPSQDALVDAALELVAGRPDLPAGSVLRCYSRAVVLVRRTGVPADSVPDRAGALAQRLLAARGRGRGGRLTPSVVSGSVPAQRTPA